MAPTIEYELAMRGRGCCGVAGIDEAGRGCWAGPVVAAAVVLSDEALGWPELLAGIDDSKQLTAQQRMAGYERIRGYARAVGVGVVPAYLIDAFGIVAATRLAMTTALLSLPCQVDALLIDALPLSDLSLPQEVLIKGDGRALSIAAASVVAKVTRDRLMEAYDPAYPGYGFALHKGYGTSLHQRALQRLGPCALHRLTFRPVIQIAGADMGEDCKESGACLERR